jgi:signal transduction histidine kinase
LKKKQDELETTSLEKDEIALLLKEKEILISSLLKSNKTAATGALSASIAHELNQPLGASLINVQFLKMMANSGSVSLASQKDLIEALETDTKRAGNIVKVLRSIFLEEELELTAINASEVLLSLTPIVEAELKAKNIQLILNIDKRIELKLSKTEFQQLILNILNNAIEALNTVDQDIKTITIDAEKTTEFTEISISDNGPGIAAPIRDGIFELLTGDKKAGMGLGLWLCRHIMQRHGGKIYVEESVTGGAKLVMRFAA